MNRSAPGNERVEPPRGFAGGQRGIGPAAPPYFERSPWFYAFASWGRKPLIPAEAESFTSHRRSGVTAVLYAAACASIVEGAIVDLLLHPHAPKTALVLLSLTALGIVWLVGFARSIVVRPSFLTEDLLCVRRGMMWTVDIPRSTIASVVCGRVAAPPKRTPGYLAAGFGAPNVLITLSKPVVALGPYGVRRDVSKVGLALDDCERFHRAIC